MSGRVAAAADGGRSVSKNPARGWADPRAGVPAPRSARGIAARLCRPDVFSMTSGIEVRDGGLPRRPGARRQEHGGRKVIIAPDGGDAWAPAKTRPDETPDPRADAGASVEADVGGGMIVGGKSILWTAQRLGFASVIIWCRRDGSPRTKASTSGTGRSSIMAAWRAGCRPDLSKSRPW
jgi:hypothetical protein